MLRIGFLFLLILLTGCAPSLYQQGKVMIEKGQYSKAVDLYYEEIKNNPESAVAWRELGVAYYKKGDLSKAEDALMQANGIQPDARANLYLGLIYEKQDMYDKALTAYRTSLGMDPPHETKIEVERRMDYLISKKVSAEATQAIKMESSINVDTIPDNTIGVVDFDNSQLAPEIAPISKGLAEMTATDLAKVYSLKVVDRTKIEAILGELKLSASQYADPKVGPRLGKLMGSRQLVSGVVTGIGAEDIRLDGAIVNTVTGDASVTDQTDGLLQQFFRIEKDFVFKIIDSLGINLTADERNAIIEVPTESFLAFLAYSKGLDYRSQGNYLEAANQFEKAVQIDGNFSAARSQMQNSKNLAAASSQSFGQFESMVGSTGSESGEGTAELQSAILSLNGFVGNTNLLNQFGNGLNLPPRPTPVYNVGTVIIRGNIDVQQ